MSLLIPRTFHQIWLGGRPLPEKFREWADRWLELNPGWQMVWWNDTHLPEMACRPEFDAAEKMAAKSDILRYEIIAKLGGVYIDSDMEPLREIESTLEGVTSFFGDERPDTPCNAIVGCVPDDPFYAEVVRRIPEGCRSPGDIVDKTGPRFLKRTIAAYLGEGHTRECQGRRWRLARKGDARRELWEYDWRVFYPYYYDEPDREWDVFPDAVAKHHWTASWWKNGGV